MLDEVLWQTPPANFGDIVLIQKFNGKKWYEFRCVKNVLGDLVLMETEKGNAKKICGLNINYISYDFPAWKKVSK